MTTGVQQFMLAQAMKSETQAGETLQAVKAAGYDGIELCTFMTRPTGMMVRLLTKAAGMPVGKGGSYNWEKLVKDAGLTVPALHVYLASLEKPEDYAETIKEAKKYGTDTIVLTGMYRFDYSNEENVHDLAKRLNTAGQHLSQDGFSLLYHNHNCELQRVNATGKRAYDIIIEETNPEFVNFEFDSYWWTEGGGDALLCMQRLGPRMRMWHINDRGSRPSEKPAMTPILKTDSMELGTGNMALTELTEQAKANGCEAIVLETHRNWIDNSPVKSLQISAKFIKEKIK